MKKVIVLIWVAIGLFSCKQGSKSTTESVEIETINTVRKYEYADATGKRIVIENSLSRGGRFTDPEGKEYSKIMFWTRISNETDKSLDLQIDFPAEPYEVPALPDKYFKLLLPPDTMTLDKESLQDYGIKDLEAFLNKNSHRATSLKRTIQPKASSGFYVVILFDKSVSGPTRTGLSIKGQNLYYKVTRYDSTPAHALVDEKEINCGSINLKDLVRQK